MNGLIKAFDSHRNIWFAIFSGIAFTLIVNIFFPLPAYADGIDDVINGWFSELFKNAANGCLQTILTVANAFTMDSALTAPFDSITSNGHGQSSAYGVIAAVKTTVIILGQSILSFALLLQLVKIAQRVDGSATLPMVKEIVMLAIFFIVFSYLVNHSFDICSAAYNEIVKVIKSFLDASVSSDAIAEIGFKEEDNVDIAGYLVVVAVLLMMLIVTFIGTAIAYALVLARGIQLYVMAACSPIPFALLAFDETRQMGIGFCKNFVSVCLAGLIIAVLVTIYPGLMSDAIQGMGVIGDDGKRYISFNAIAAIVPMLGVSLMYIFALFKSGSWARDIMGG